MEQLLCTVYQISGDKLSLTTYGAFTQWYTIEHSHCALGFRTPTSLLVGSAAYHKLSWPLEVHYSGVINQQTGWEPLSLNPNKPSVVRALTMGIPK